MRLIDADRIEKFIENGLNNPDKKKAFGYDAIEILTEVHFAPTIDAVPAPNYRVPSTDEWMERYGTKKQVAGYEKRKENSSNVEV